VDWIHLAQDRDQWRTLVNTVMNFMIPLTVRNLTGRETISFSRTLLDVVS
jgi:hypothetical protein